MVLDRKDKAKGEKIELEEDECIDVGALTQDSGLDSVTLVPRSGFIHLLDWLTRELNGGLQSIRMTCPNFPAIM